MQAPAPSADIPRVQARVDTREDATHGKGTTATLNPPTLADLLDLHGRTAIVTGGAMGIGRGIVERLAEAGASVVIADADREPTARPRWRRSEDGPGRTTGKRL